MIEDVLVAHSYLATYQNISRRFPVEDIRLPHVMVPAQTALQPTISTYVIHTISGGLSLVTFL